MGTWSARTTMAGSPDRLLEVLTDPDTCTAWSPIAFDVEDLTCDRLDAGCTARVGGELAGQRVFFDVNVLEAQDGRFRLTASGPVDLAVEYRAEAADERSDVFAQVEVRGRGGLRGKLVSVAADAAVAGMLPLAVERIAQTA